MSNRLPSQNQSGAPGCGEGVSRLLASLAGVRKRLLAVRFGIGISLMVMLAISVIGATMIVDWLVELPLWLRTLILLAQVCGLGALFFFHIAKPWQRQPDDDTVALMIEKARPSFRSRLIASVQLGRGFAAAQAEFSDLVAELVKETEAHARPMDLREVINVRDLKRHVLAGAALLLLALIVVADTRQSSLPLLRRAFLSEIEVPRKTRVDKVDCPRLVGRGDNVTLVARARGYLPDQGVVQLAYASGHKEELIMLADKKERGKFSLTINNVQDNFAFRVRIFDGASERIKVEVLARPEVAFLECQQIYPAYTGMGKVRRALGDLTLLAGSKLEITATATKEVARASIRLYGLDRDLPMAIDPKDRRQLSATLPIPSRDLNGMSIHMTDLFGIQSANPAVYRVDIEPDKPPIVKVTYPERKEDLVTSLASLLIGFDVVDDYAVGKLQLRYLVDAQSQAAAKTVELDLGGELPKSLRRRFEWQLRQLTPPLAEGSTVEYWIEAADANTETGPGIGASEHFIVRVVSEAEKRSDLMNRASDYLGGIGEVTKDQEKLNQSLGRIIRAKP